jgi:hypothetical protein|tara:strand:- start:112 stop:213 length:102 start_codon:yes stop_codon:yes gene_type:complete
VVQARGDISLGIVQVNDITDDIESALNPSFLAY